MFLQNAYLHNKYQQKYRPYSCKQGGSIKNENIRASSTLEHTQKGQPVWYHPRTIFVYQQHPLLLAKDPNLPTALRHFQSYRQFLHKNLPPFKIKIIKHITPSNLSSLNISLFLDWCLEWSFSGWATYWALRISGMNNWWRCRLNAWRRMNKCCQWRAIGTTGSTCLEF